MYIKDTEEEVINDSDLRVRKDFGKQVVLNNFLQKKITRHLILLRKNSLEYDKTHYSF